MVAYGAGSVIRSPTGFSGSVSAASASSAVLVIGTSYDHG